MRDVVGPGGDWVDCGLGGNGGGGGEERWRIEVGSIALGVFGTEKVGENERGWCTVKERLEWELGFLGTFGAGCEASGGAAG